VFANDPVLALDDFGVIQPRVFAVNPFGFGVDEAFPNFRCVQQRFGGNATNVQTGPAQLGVFLN